MHYCWTCLVFRKKLLIRITFIFNGLCHNEFYFGWSLFCSIMYLLRVSGRLLTLPSWFVSRWTCLDFRKENLLIGIHYMWKKLSRIEFHFWSSLSYSSKGPLGVDRRYLYFCLDVLVIKLVKFLEKNIWLVGIFFKEWV